MSELYNTWKVKDRGVAKSATPLLGMVYKAKHNGSQVIGILQSITEDQAWILTKEKKVVIVDKKTLKIVVDS